MIEAILRGARPCGVTGDSVVGQFAYWATGPGFICHPCSRLNGPDYRSITGGLIRQLFSGELRSPRGSVLPLGRPISRDRPEACATATAAGSPLRDRPARSLRHRSKASAPGSPGLSALRLASPAESVRPPDKPAPRCPPPTALAPPAWRVRLPASYLPATVRRTRLHKRAPGLRIRSAAA